MVGKILMTVATLSYGLLPLFMDISHTHVLNPDWTGHARLHNVWLIGITAGLGLWSLWLIWGVKDNPLASIRQACLNGVIVLGAFLLAVFTSPLYGGSIVVPVDGQVPTEGVYGNVIAFSISLLLMIIGWFLAERKVKAKLV